MVTVPVFVPSYDQSGETHVVAVGDRVSWELAAVDAYLPPHLVRQTDAIAEPAESPLPSLNYYPTLVRQGAFVAWWDADEPVTGRVQARLLFRIGDSRLPEEGVPPSRGVVHADVLRLRPSPPTAGWTVGQCSRSRRRRSGVDGGLARGRLYCPFPRRRGRCQRRSLAARRLGSDAPVRLTAAPIGRFRVDRRGRPPPWPQ